MKRAAFNALPSPGTLSILRSSASAVTNLVSPRLLSNHQTVIAIRGGRIRNPMSSDVKSKAIEEGEKQAPVEEAKMKKKEVPPPPEQPEPGDCCGSGCVRCVWDVYYDELEEYNKLLKEIDSSPPDASSKR